MYSKILAPVDLAHADRLQKALRTAADMAAHFNAPVIYVGVTTTTPSSVAPTPEAYREKLDAFVQGQASTHGHSASGHVVVSHDPSVDMDEALLKAIDETGADLVVMATHVPGVADHWWPSNGGAVAGHARASVFLVRDAS